MRIVGTCWTATGGRRGGSSAARPAARARLLALAGAVALAATACVTETEERATGIRTGAVEPGHPESGRGSDIASRADRRRVVPDPWRATAAESGSRAQTEASLDGLAVPSARPTSPTRIDLPALGLSAAVGEVGLEPDGTLAVPDDTEPAWYRHSPLPGERGPAILVGHRDLHGEVGVFARLEALKPGDGLLIEDLDGQRHGFIVERVERFAKEDFPHEEVYGNTDGPEVRLITCGGAFSAGSYEDNVVVFARAGPTSDTG